jgi:hypothetical protein
LVIKEVDELQTVSSFTGVSLLLRRLLSNSVIPIEQKTQTKPTKKEQMMLGNLIKYGPYV